VLLPEICVVDNQTSAGRNPEPVLVITSMFGDPVTLESSDANPAEPMRLLRLERDRRLTETDWTVIRAYSQKQDVPKNWASYMQALRDLPATAEPQLDVNGNLTNITWPEVPQ
jgi:hypothetical protein